MELRHLRYFVAVAEAENVSRAAAKLHVSQPALSRQVRDLEEELGFQLLERSAKSVRLSEAGRVFLREAQAVLLRVEEAVGKAAATARGGRSELHIGYAPTLTARILPATLRAFQMVQPSVLVKLHDLSTEEMLAGLRDSRLQLAFLVRPRPAVLRGLVFESLLRDSLLLAVTPQHRFAGRPGVTLREAAAEPFIAYGRKEYPDYHDLLAKVFAEVKGRPRIVEEHDGVSSLISAVEAGNGVALVSASLGCVAGPRLKLVELEPAPAPLELGLVSLKGGRSGVADAFAESALKAVGALPALTEEASGRRPRTGSGGGKRKPR